MRISRREAVRAILSAFRARGWNDPGGAAVAVVRALETSKEPQALDMESLIPTEFLARNGVSRRTVAQTLIAVLGDVKLNGGGAANELGATLKILFVATNPVDQDQLALDDEYRSVQQRLRSTERRDRIVLASRWATRPEDLIDALNEERPQVLHFSGHGSAMDELVFRNDAGNSIFVPLDAIASTISTVSDDVRLAVFNSCYSANAAAKVVDSIGAAVGMADAIHDDAARVFAAQLYSSLGFGLSLARAFSQAIAQLKMAGIPDDQIPRLYTGPGTDVERLILVPPDQ